MRKKKKKRGRIKETQGKLRKEGINKKIKGRRRKEIEIIKRIKRKNWKRI